MGKVDKKAIATRGLVGYTFDEFKVGDEHWSPARTITEADLVNFSAFSADWNPHHVDELFAQEAGMGERLAHGAMLVAVASGLFVRTRIFEKTIVALLEWNYKFTKPVLIGTRVQVRIRVKDLKETKNPERGIVTFEVAAFDEEDEQLALAEWKILMLRSSAA